MVGAEGSDNDQAEQAALNDGDQAIHRAIGDELRRARAHIGWTRPTLVQQLTTPMPVNTYACYEQGIRPCPIPRLVEICHTLGVGVAELIGLALQRLELDLEKHGVRIDLHRIVRDEREELRLLRQWALNRLKKHTAGVDEPAVVLVPWVVMNEMGTLLGVSRKRLLSFIHDFAPESAARTDVPIKRRRRAKGQTARPPR